MKGKFFLISYGQKIIIAGMCFGFNNSPLTVHSILIALKIIILFLYSYFKPYLRQGFTFFKIIQEIHFILISIFLIILDKIG
jgi:hypothetical protein